MASQEEMLAEAYKRDLLPLARKVAYEEAMRRGLVADVTPADRDPTEGMSGFDKFRAGWGRAVANAGRGIEEIVANAGQANAGLARDTGFMGTLGGVPIPVSKELANRSYELATQDVAAVRSKIDEAKKLDAPLLRTGAGMAGNITGNVAMAAPAMLVPGANTVAGAAVAGAVQGAIEPVGSEGDRFENIATNTVLSAGLSTAFKLLGTMKPGPINPTVRPEVKELLEAGVTPTPGQLIGGAAKRTEEAATSIPIAGDMIRSRQAKAVVEFNRAALNRALAPISKAIEKDAPIGRDAIEKTHSLISGAYDQLLPKLSGAMDNGLKTAFAAVLKDAGDTLPKEQASQFGKILSSQVLRRFDKSGKISGEDLKAAHSAVGLFMRRFGKTEGADQQQMAQLFGKANDAFKSMITRNNPTYAKELASTDTAYALMLRIENAAARSKSGVFTPSQLVAATKAMDQSLRKTQFARGGALMQDFAEGAENVLGKTVPDSGTPYRASVGFLTGGGGELVGLDRLLGIAATGGVYTEPVQKLIANLLTRNPGLAEDIARRGAIAAPALSPLTEDAE